MEKIHSCSAHYIKVGLNLAKIEVACHELTLYRRERNCLIYKLSETQFLAVYSFGVLVTFDVHDKKNNAHYIRLVSRGGEVDDAISVENALTDNYDLLIDPDQPDTVEFNQVRLHEFNLEKVFIVMHVLAQSVAIDFMERQVEEHLQKFEKMNLSLSRRGRVEVPASEVMKVIGASGSMMNFVIGKLSLLDKPDIAWDDREAESLFMNMRKMYELADRFEALQFKFTFIQESSGRLLDILQHKHANFLEWIIILLFVLDIFVAFL
jgi:uncharacterized Rmd1/YagE family protein